MIPVTYIIIGITVVVSFICFKNVELRRKFLFNAYQVAQRKEYWRLFTNGVIHADYFHLGINMYILYLFGLSGGFDINGQFFMPGVEETFANDFGTKGIFYFVILYVGALFFSSLPALKKHGNNPNYNSLGASGATSAVLFSAIVLNPLMGLKFIFFPFFAIPAFAIGILYLVYENYQGKRGGTGIAHDAHIGGAIFGILFTLFIRPSYGLEFIEQIKTYIAGIIG